ncbi:MAG TPA: exodeoxyribonuclease VII large subunit [Erysipelothrix sp.]|nr:exodeoxyribonuclease VII large subunit [Erysipelothrix sp.]
MRNDILSVKELLKHMKQTINQDQGLQNVALIGEVSNFSAHRSGHFYFNLKDEESRISCVMFKFKSASVLFKPKDGDKVILVGRVDVFEASGSVQFYTDKMILDGLGQLHQEYEKLKLEFQAKGYFDQARKKELKAFPSSLVLITGANSAAYADMHRTIKERWPAVKVYDFLSLVQGVGAKEQIVARIQEAQSLAPDLIVLARGGGSIEDLWAFNDPIVVEAIAASSYPIITGIGHESDTTLSDLVADYRAATPTAAIVAGLPSYKDIQSQLRNYKNQFYLAVRNKYKAKQALYQAIQERSAFKEPMRMIDKRAHLLDFHKQHLVSALKRFDQSKEDIQNFRIQSTNLIQRKVDQAQQKIESFKIMGDYALEKGILQQQQVLNHKIQVLDYSKRNLINKIHQDQLLLKDHDQRFISQIQSRLSLNQRSFVDIIKVINSLSPLSIMAKGYALTYHDDTIIKSSGQIDIDDHIKIQYSDGTIEAKVTGKDQKQ